MRKNPKIKPKKATTKKVATKKVVTKKQLYPITKILGTKKVTKKYSSKVTDIYKNELRLNKGNIKKALTNTKINLGIKENQLIYKFDKKGKRYFTSQQTGKRLKGVEVRKIIYKSILTKIAKQKMKVENITTFKKSLTELKRQLRKNNLTQIIKKLHYGT